MPDFNPRRSDGSLDKSVATYGYNGWWLEGSASSRDIKTLERLPIPTKLHPGDSIEFKNAAIAGLAVLGTKYQKTETTSPLDHSFRVQVFIEGLELWANPEQLALPNSSS